MLSIKWIRIALLYLCTSGLILSSSVVYSREDKNLSVISEAVAFEVEIYTTSICGECLKAKNYLKVHKIAYKEYNVQENRDLLKRFYQIGGKGVPLIFVNGQKMEGFDEQEFESKRHAN